MPASIAKARGTGPSSLKANLVQRKQMRGRELPRPPLLTFLFELFARRHGQLLLRDQQQSRSAIQMHIFAARSYDRCLARARGACDKFQIIQSIHATAIRWQLCSAVRSRR